MAGKKKNKKRNKNDLPVLDSDDDFLKAFEPEEKKKGNRSVQTGITRGDSDPRDNCMNEDDPVEEEDFASLLEASFNLPPSKPLKKSEPLSLKQRLKRYPGVELELDLHGYNAMGAQLKIRSFIHSCKYNGYFTIRIIVGKGLHSEDGAVLPEIAEDELKELKKQNLVIFYEWDKKIKKRNGSLIVYLKQFDEYD